MDDLISRETMKDLIDITTWYHQNRNGVMVAGASDEETAWFKAKDVFKAIENVPSAQQEITEKQVKEYCEKRCLIVLSSDAFHRLKSGSPERCEDCVNFNKARLLIPQPERKKGKWIKMSDADGIYWACSECGEDLPRVSHYNPQFDLFPRLESIEKTKFCPNCGARMEGGDAE